MIKQVKKGPRQNYDFYKICENYENSENRKIVQNLQKGFEWGFSENLQGHLIKLDSKILCSRLWKLQIKIRLQCISQLKTSKGK